MAKKNIRRTMLAQMAEMKRKLAQVVSDWDVRSTVFESGTKIRECDPVRWPHHPINENGKALVEFLDNKVRMREAHEYPENQYKTWEDLHEEMKALETMARQMKEIALKRARGLRYPEFLAPCGCNKVIYNQVPGVDHHTCTDGLNGWIKL